jgi:hypothetical protein
MTMKSLASLLFWTASATLGFCGFVNCETLAQISQADPITVGTFSFPAGKNAVQVPFELLANAVFVSTEVNGKGPFLFAIDTGSAGSVFASELVQELGVQPRGEAQGMGAGANYKMGVVRGKIEFDLPGGLKLSTDDANTVSMAGLWPLIGKRIYGDIGYDVLKDLVVEFDYEKKLVTFEAPIDYHYAGKGRVLDATLWMNYDPQISGTFAGVGMKAVSTPFTIDTGAGGTIITTPLVKANSLLKAGTDKIPSPSHGVGGGESNDEVSRIESISLGPYKIRQPLVALSQDTAGSLAMENMGINLGGNILRRFTVIIDYPHGTVILEPNSHFADPFLADASGLVLKAEGSNFRTVVVQGVVSGSPAASAGLQENDEISTVDGEPAGKYALWELQDLLKNAGRRLKLTMKRGTRSFVCEIVLRSLA